MKANFSAISHPKYVMNLSKTSFEQNFPLFYCATNNQVKAQRKMVIFATLTESEKTPFD